MQNILFVLSFHLPFIVNGQGLDIEFIHPEPNVLTFKITNITNYDVMIWCGLEGEGKSGILFDQIVGKKDTIRDLFGGLYPEEPKYTILLSPRQTYTKTYKQYTNLYTRMIKAKVYLRYIIRSNPRKFMHMNVVFDIKYSELNFSGNTL